MADTQFSVSDFPIPPGGFQPTPPLDPGIVIPGMGGPLGSQPTTTSPFEQPHPNQAHNYSGAPSQFVPQMPMMPGMPGMGNMERFSESEFVIDSEEVELPSKGIFYKNGKSSVIVQHLTAMDEDILTSESLRRKGTQFDVLLRRKIVDQDIDISTMLSQDKMAILIWLRRNGYGADYHVEVMDPQTLERFPAVVDLMKLKYKEVTHVPDHNGHFMYKLPISGKVVRFRILNDREQQEVETQIESMGKLQGGIDPTIITMLTSQIVDVDGNSDKLWIKKFVSHMQLRDSRRLQLFMGEVLPGLDLSYTYTNPNTGRTFQSFVPITMELFYPTQGI